MKYILVSFMILAHTLVYANVNQYEMNLIQSVIPGSKILDAENRAKQQEQNQAKKSLIGSGDRSEKIRTYNYNQNRITDHRVSLTLKKLDRVMQGNLDEVIEVLLASEKENSL